jgi:hypothetical protein
MAYRNIRTKGEKRLLPGPCQLMFAISGPSQHAVKFNLTCRKPASGGKGNGFGKPGSDDGRRVLEKGESCYPIGKSNPVALHFHEG